MGYLYELSYGFVWVNKYDASWKYDLLVFQGLIYFTDVWTYNNIIWTLSWCNNIWETRLSMSSNVKTNLANSWKLWKKWWLVTCPKSRICDGPEVRRYRCPKIQLSEDTHWQSIYFCDFQENLTPNLPPVPPPPQGKLSV